MIKLEYTFQITVLLFGLILLFYRWKFILIVKSVIREYILRNIDVKIQYFLLRTIHLLTDGISIQKKIVGVAY